MVKRVTATEATLELLEKLKEKHGPLLFHQSGGCCDGSSPMCYPEGDLMLGTQDLYLGTIGDTPFYINKKQYDYWKHTQLIIDVVDGSGGMFSVEGVEGKRFLSRSRAFTEEERKELQAEEKV
ncbi:DUF779 domain-containing protein [Halobacillus locisalis]|uniref:DUF779 domain-containing protein n=1 Tax=Halobacillus locisalis TaxID=220753 RepID=A0A838CTX1_9BACI|nr:DUF779 domain-containing protein [Halobacillus locisalis]MBA2175076.1 DUF779 domain-containing protein [Halobacillus locisalis]